MFCIIIVTIIIILIEHSKYVSNHSLAVWTGTVYVANGSGWSRAACTPDQLGSGLWLITSLLNHPHPSVHLLH